MKKFLLLLPLAFLALTGCGENPSTSAEDSKSEPAVSQPESSVPAETTLTRATKLENGKTYKLGLEVKGTTYYFTGAMDSHDLGTTEAVKDAVDVKAELSGKKVALSFKVSGATKYLKFEHVDSGKNHFDNAIIVDEAWQFDYTEGTDYLVSAVMNAGTEFEKTCVFGADGREGKEKTTISPRNYKYAATTNICGFYAA